MGATPKMVFFFPTNPLGIPTTIGVWNGGFPPPMIHQDFPDITSRTLLKASMQLLQAQTTQAAGIHWGETETRNVGFEHQNWHGG